MISDCVHRRLWVENDLEMSNVLTDARLSSNSRVRMFSDLFVNTFVKKANSILFSLEEDLGLWRLQNLTNVAFLWNEAINSYGARVSNITYGLLRYSQVIHHGPLDQVVIGERVSERKKERVLSETAQDLMIRSVSIFTFSRKCLYLCQI